MHTTRGMKWSKLNKINKLWAFERKKNARGKENGENGGNKQDWKGNKLNRGYNERCKSKGRYIIAFLMMPLGANEWTGDSKTNELRSTLRSYLSF